MKITEILQKNAEAAKKYIDYKLFQKQDKLTFDNAPTKDSANIVTSGAIEKYIDDIRKNMSQPKKIELINPDPEIQSADYNVEEAGGSIKKLRVNIPNPDSKNPDDYDEYYYPGSFIYGYIDVVLPGYEPGTADYNERNSLPLSLVEGDTVTISFTHATKTYKPGDKVDCSGNFFKKLTLGQDHVEQLSQSAQEYMRSIKITDLSDFYSINGCTIDVLDISGWDTSECTSFCESFQGFNIDKNGTVHKGKIIGLESLNTSKVTTIVCMFSSGYYNICLAYDTLDLSKWNMSSCNNFNAFLSSNNITINTLDISGWGTHPLGAKTNHMFEDTDIKNIIIDGPFFSLNGDPKINTTTKIYVPQSLIDQYKADTAWSTYKNQFYVIEKIISFTNASGWTMTVKNAANNTTISPASDGKYYLDRETKTIIVSGTNGTNTITEHTIDTSTMNMAEELKIDITTLQ